MKKKREAKLNHDSFQLRYFESREKRTMLPGFTPYIQRHVDEAIRFGGIKPGMRVLEIGCGMGRHTFSLAEKGIKIEGLDLSAVLLERLRQFDAGRYNIQVYCADVLNLPTEWKGKYDAVIGFFVLHHLFDLPGIFKEMARLTVPGGRIVFVEPNPYSPLYYLQMTLVPGMTWRGESGILNMRKSVIFCAMQEAGFTNPDLHRFGFFPPFLANQPWGARLEKYLEKINLWRPLLPFQLFRGEKV